MPRNLKRFLGERSLLLGAAVLIVVGLMAVAAPLVFPARSERYEAGGQTFGTGILPLVVTRHTFSAPIFWGETC